MVILLNYTAILVCLSDFNNIYYYYFKGSPINCVHTCDLLGITLQVTELLTML